MTMRYTKIIIPGKLVDIIDLIGGIIILVVYMLVKYTWPLWLIMIGYSIVK